MNFVCSVVLVVLSLVFGVVLGGRFALVLCGSGWCRFKVLGFATVCVVGCVVTGRFGVLDLSWCCLLLGCFAFWIFLCVGFWGIVCVDLVVVGADGFYWSVW